MNYCDDAGDDWELFLHFDIVWPLFYVTSNEAAHPNGNRQEAHFRFLPFVFSQTKVCEGGKMLRNTRALGTFQILLYYTIDKSKGLPSQRSLKCGSAYPGQTLP